ncbi:MAG: hypothetical protein HQK87_06105 [Nitrospinae bacterium]|nr:hypothetical protein [Nitrospinota bacterium]
MAKSKSSQLSLREKFHDVNNALQGLSNLIIALRRDETYTPEIGDLLSATFDRIKERVEAARAEAIEGIAAPAPSSRPSAPVRFPVLLVDPDPLSRRMSAARLKALGYVAVAVDGETAALEELSSDRGIRAAVVDAVNPDSTSRLCKSLLRAAPDLGIIFSCHESVSPPDATLLGFTPVGTLRKPLKAHRVAELMAQIGKFDEEKATFSAKGAD